MSHYRALLSAFIKDHAPAFCIVALFTLLCLLPFNAEAGQNKTGYNSKWSVLAGYGSSHPGWGETKARIETIDLVFRYSTLIAENIGSSWYSGYHTLFIEVPFHYLLDHEDSPMVGINFLANYTFTESILQPYVFAGGGPVYVGADIPGMGSDWNGNYQLGAGVSYPLSDSHRLFLEARYHHISNGNTKDPNDPLNSAKFLIGLSF